MTDPRNLGAIIRSALAFGAQGVIIPERRAAGVTATTWRTSAGAAARLPVVKVTNLVRTLKQCQTEGMLVAGLDADGDTSLSELQAATDPLVLVVGSEGRGLSRLVGETCDLTVSIPMAEGRRIAQRLGGRRGHAGRDRPPPRLSVGRPSARLGALGAVRVVANVAVKRRRRPGCPGRLRRAERVAAS